jgi:carbamoyltransferase
LEGETLLVLGLSAYSHEASACLVKNGKPVALVEEERVNREKHTWKFPEGAILEIFRMTNIKPEAIDSVTFFWKPWKEVTDNMRHFLAFFPESLHLFFSGSGSDELSFIHRFILLNQIKKKLLAILPGLNPKIQIFNVDHHLSHAASCFLMSPFEDAAILTLDGRGEAATAFLGKGEGHSITKLSEWRVPHSLGHFYSAITDFLGFYPFYDEYKVMGLSAYGSDRYCNDFKEIVQWLPGGRFHLDLSYFSFHTHGRDRWMSPKFYDKFGPPRQKNMKDEEMIGGHYCDIAFAAQSRIEEVAVLAARDLKRRTGSENLVMAGGVFQNCRMNSKIVEKSGFSKFFFQPLANDAGTSLGSALYYTHITQGLKRNHIFDSVFLGPEYQPDEIEKVLKSYNIRYTVPENMAQVCAGYISRGFIVGWFQGRMESGPRALGNRSIIADPRDNTMRDTLNRRIKKRELFRPFAASVLIEYADEYFDLPTESPYMQILSRVKTNKVEVVPAIVHVDGTTRVQTVSKSTHPLFRELIEEFHQLTNIPLVLNTSFNDNEPIVMSPEHAIACFLKTGMDVLAIGPFLVKL